MLAVVETSAHLRLLVEQGEVAERVADGVHRYAAIESRG